jgi:hemerythrin
VRPIASRPKEAEALILRQHGRIERLLRELKSLLANDAPASERSVVVGALAAYFRQHFEIEEELMRQHGYPEVARHALQHGHFRERLERIVAECEKQDPSRDRELPTSIDEFHRWFLQHEEKEDRALLDYLSPHED